MPPIFSGECSTELAAHLCNPCPDPSEREFGRVRTAGFIFSDYIAALMANPTSVALWVTGIQTGKIIIVPETAGDYDPGDPKSLKGYGDRSDTKGPRTMTLKFIDPNLTDNYPHYNGLGNQTELIPFFRTSSQTRIFDKPASITAKDPVADDLESEVTWEVTAVVISNNLPGYFPAANLMNTIFKCSYLNGITVTGTTFDTALGFGAASTVSLENVTGVISAVDPDVKFEFNKIASPTGLPNDMNINLGGTLVMVVTFLADYAGQPFKYTDANGTAHTGIFTNGTVNL